MTRIFSRRDAKAQRADRLLGRGVGEGFGSDPAEGVGGVVANVVVLVCEEELQAAPYRFDPCVGICGARSSPRADFRVGVVQGVCQRGYHLGRVQVHGRKCPNSANCQNEVRRLRICNEHWHGRGSVCSHHRDDGDYYSAIALWSIRGCIEQGNQSWLAYAGQCAGGVACCVSPGWIVEERNECGNGLGCLRTDRSEGYARFPRGLVLGRSDALWQGWIKAIVVSKSHKDVGPCGSLVLNGFEKVRQGVCPDCLDSVTRFVPIGIVKLVSGVEMDPLAQRGSLVARFAGAGEEKDGAGHQAQAGEQEKAFPALCHGRRVARGGVLGEG